MLTFIDDCYHTDGIRIFFIDEIHKYPQWNQILKNVYDSFPDVSIIFSGSSSLDIIKGSSDLSRRAGIFSLRGMSFREYLNFITGEKWEPIRLQRLLDSHLKMGREWAAIPKIMGHFNQYLSRGYYPFLFENSSLYYERINQVIEKTIYEDIVNYFSLKTPNLPYFKNILNYLVSIPPGSINIHSIARHLQIDDKTAYQYLKILKETGLVRFVQSYAKGKQVLSKPQKIFLNNTTLHFAIENFLGINSEKGTIRELFFLQSIDDSNIILANDQVDFQIDNVLFEIGGKNKNSQQLNKSNLPGFIVKDGILIGDKNTIPLWYFGFCY